MNRETAVESIRRLFGFLAEKGELKITSPLKRAENAAGWVINVVSEAFCVRLILDRGQVFVEVGAGPVARSWYDLGVIMPFLTKGQSTFEYYIPEGPISDEEIERQIARGVEVIRENSAMIASFFLADGFEERESELVAFRKERSAERWNRLLR